MLARPTFQIRGRDGHSDSDARVQAKRRREGSAYLADGRVVDREAHSVKHHFGMSLAAPQRFAQLSASEKIQGFDQTEAGREAQDELAIRPCQTSKRGSDGSEICDAVQSGEVRKCTIKLRLWSKLTDAFCGQLTEEYGKTIGMLLKTLLGLDYHLPRSIASQDGDAVAGEEDG